MSRPLSYWAWLAASVSHVALLALIVAEAGLSKPALLAVPLLLPLVGILRRRPYTCSWASMLVVFYAAGYLASGYAHPESKGWSFGLATLAAVDFVGLVMFVRWLQRERPARSAA